MPDAELPDHPDKPLVDKYMSGRASGILSFGIKGAGNAKAAGGRFIGALKLVAQLVNIGDAKSLACRLATTTHRQLTVIERESAGVSEDLVRLSKGMDDRFHSR